jgi:hypothetical protein
MRATETLLQAIAVTVELTSTQLSEAAARVLAEDLARYPEAQVLEALTRCRRELKGRLTIAEVLSRIDDGRPGPEEAWAMMPTSEEQSVVWTAEMAGAFGVAFPLMREGDHVAARMAFLETYKTLCRRARDAGTPARWTASLGHDPHAREPVLLEAQRLGRLPADYVAGLLPHRAEPAPEIAALLPDMSAPPGRRTLKDALIAVRKERVA